MRHFCIQTVWIVILVFGLSIGLAGCGTINSRITSEPTGAQVSCNDQSVGTTPLELPLKDGLGQDAFVIKVEKNGYKTQSTEIREQRFTRFDLPSKWIPTNFNFVLSPDDQSAKE